VTYSPPTSVFFVVVRQVQVIPWSLGDSTFSVHPSYRQEPSKTVFVGALHGMMSAEALGHIMNDLFGNVVYAGIDTDKHKYPIGRRLILVADKTLVGPRLPALSWALDTPKG